MAEKSSVLEGKTTINSVDFIHALCKYFTHTNTENLGLPILIMYARQKHWSKIILIYLNVKNVTQILVTVYTLVTFYTFAWSLFVRDKQGFLQSNLLQENTHI